MQRGGGGRRHRRLSKFDAATAYNFAVVPVFLCVFTVAGFALEAFAALALCALARAGFAALVLAGLAVVAALGGVAAFS
jgi:hypothetical protein